MAFDKPGKPDDPGRKTDASPSGYRIVEEGRRYWSNRPTSNGKVAGIPFGAPGSFDECVDRVTPHLGAGAKGYCAERYHDSVGRWPGRGHDDGGK
jgi:hypothetical protein